MVYTQVSQILLLHAHKSFTFQVNLTFKSSLREKDRVKKYGRVSGSEGLVGLVLKPSSTAEGITNTSVKGLGVGVGDVQFS